MSTLTARIDPIIRQCLDDDPGDQPLAQDADLRSLGLDSMRAVQLFFALEAEFGITFPDDAVSAETVATPAAVAAAVARLAQG